MYFIVNCDAFCHNFNKDFMYGCTSQIHRAKSLKKAQADSLMGPRVSTAIG